MSLLRGAGTFALWELSWRRATIVRWWRIVKGV